MGLTSLVRVELDVLWTLGVSTQRQGETLQHLVAIGRWLLHVEFGRKEERLVAFDGTGDDIARFHVRVDHEIARSNEERVIGESDLLWMRPDGVGCCSLALNT